MQLLFDLYPDSYPQVSQSSTQVYYPKYISTTIQSTNTSIASIIGVVFVFVYYDTYHGQNAMSYKAITTTSDNAE